MLKKLMTFTLLLIIPVMFFTGWKSTDAITSFYYYKGQPFFLTPKKDAIFIKFDKNVTNESIRSILASENMTLQAVDISNQQDRAFVTFNAQQNDAALLDMVSRLSSRSDVKYASPVFSPDQGKTLIGVEDEIMAQFKPSMTESEIISFVQSKGMSVKQKMDLTGGLSYILTVNQNDFAMDAANEVYRSGKVNWSEPSLFYTNLTCNIPNDPFYGSQWSINNTGTNIPSSGVGVLDCDMDVDSAWNLTQSNNHVIVAINDTGCDTLHEDLAVKFIPGTGYNFYNNTPGGKDDMGHGTCCAGIIGAATNNGIGIAGIAPNVMLLPVKWMNSSGSGTTAGATNAIIYCYQKGAWVISNSWGFQGGSSSAMDQAINDCTTLGRGGKGTLFVVAAGNENSSAMRYPANTHPKVLVVGGISPCNQRKNTSSCDLENFWGASYGTNLHVVAPCVKIYATDMTGSGGFTSNNYDATFNGTSSATPNVAGVCGLVFGADSNVTWDSVRARIDRTCEKRGLYTYTAGGPVSAGTWNQEMGYGLVNAYAAVKLTMDMIDAVKPVIYHTAIPNIAKSQWPVMLNAKVKDNLGVDSAWVRWYKNSSTTIKQFKLTNTSDSSFSALFNSDTSEVSLNDVIHYKIFAQDISMLHNRDSSALYSFTITSLTGTGNNAAVIPDRFSLDQNYPNPFNPATSIQYAVPEQSFVSINVYDITGKVVAVLVNETKTPGVYNINFNAEALSSGMYFYRLETKDFTDTKRMLLIK